MCPEASFLTSLILGSPSEPGGQSGFVSIRGGQALDLSHRRAPGATGLSTVAHLLGDGKPPVCSGGWTWVGGEAAGTPASGHMCLSFPWLFSKVLWARFIRALVTHTRAVSACSLKFLGQAPSPRWQRWEEAPRLLRLAQFRESPHHRKPRLLYSEELPFMQPEESGEVVSIGDGRKETKQHSEPNKHLHF